MKIEFTYEVIFGFEGPNLCLLGNKKDFQKLGEVIANLTIPNDSKLIEITILDFVEVTGDDRIKVLFSSKPGAENFGNINEEKDVLLFELDDRYWERIFKFFAFMSWDERTYYLNSFEDCLQDLPL